MGQLVGALVDGGQGIELHPQVGPDEVFLLWRAVAGTVLLLGAGASRGAVFPNGVPHECLPPLNADFFTQLQRITEDKHSTSVRRVVKDLVQLHGSNFSLTLEDYFTELEFLSRVV